LAVLRTVQKDARGFNEELLVLSRHVTNAKNATDRATTKFERLSGKLDHVDLLGAEPKKISASKTVIEGLDHLPEDVQQELPK
jgi:hypothetical protein